MYKKFLSLSSLILVSSPILNTVQVTKTNREKALVDKIKNLPLNEGLNLIKNSIIQTYNENASLFDKVPGEQAIFALYKQIINNKKEANVQRAYENRFESSWWWFGYWKWYVTWKGFISTITDMTGAGIDAYQTWDQIKPALHAALLLYLGTAGAVPIVGAILGGTAALLATSIMSAVAGHRLWESPQSEIGIVMSFYLVIYTGSWSQW